MSTFQSICVLQHIPRYQVDGFPPKVITRVGVVQEGDQRSFFLLCVDCAIFFDANIVTILPQQHDVRRVDSQGVTNYANDGSWHQKLRVLAALGVDCCIAGATTRVINTEQRPNHADTYLPA